MRGQKIKKPHSEVSPEEDPLSLDEGAMRRFVREHGESKNIAGKSAPNLQIIYDDAHFFVIDKPAGVRTEVFTAGFFPVHRLDKDTSGILLIAKDSATQTTFQQQWKNRTVHKIYLALVAGHLTPKKGLIEGSIGRSQKNRTKMAVSSLLKARSAETEYEVVEYVGVPRGGTYTLLRAFPKTGRTHQIRVHLSSIGFPVVGDDTYGDELLNEKFGKKYGLVRQFLHAEKLTLTNPTTEKEQTFTAKLSDDLKACYAALTSSTSSSVKG